MEMWIQRTQNQLHVEWTRVVHTASAQRGNQSRPDYLCGRQVAGLLPNRKLEPSSPLDVAQASLPSPLRLTITRCGQRLGRVRAWP